MRSITGMGVEYECRVSRARAQQLIGEGKDLPRMGWERDIEKVPDVRHPTWMGFSRHLVLMNISGTFVLASHDTMVKDWVHVFGAKYQFYVDRAETAAGH